MWFVGGGGHGSCLLVLGVGGSIIGIRLGGSIIRIRLVGYIIWILPGVSRVLIPPVVVTVFNNVVCCTLGNDYEIFII